MSDDPEKIAKKARKAEKKMRKAREQMRAAKAEMRAARHEALGLHRGNGPHIRIESCDGIEEFEIPEELRRKGREFARTVTGPLVRDLAAAGLIAAGAAIAAKERKKKPDADTDSDAEPGDGETPDVEAAAEDLSDKADELGQALNALANAALAKFLGPKGFTTRH